MFDPAAASTLRQKLSNISGRQSSLLFTLWSRGLSFHSFSAQPCMKFLFLKKHFALRALAHFTIPKSVWLSRGITQPMSASQEKQKRYVQGYERTVNPTKYFSNDAGGGSVSLPGGFFCLRGAGSGLWLLLDISVTHSTYRKHWGHKAALHDYCDVAYYCTFILAADVSHRAHNQKVRQMPVWGTEVQGHFYHHRFHFLHKSSRVAVCLLYF